MIHTITNANGDYGLFIGGPDEFRKNQLGSTLRALTSPQKCASFIREVIEAEGAENLDFRSMGEAMDVLDELVNGFANKR